jgi:N utilization substance protein A
MPGIYSQIEELSRQKNIDPAIVMDAVKDAILVAARKYYKSNEELIAELNPDTGNVEVFAIMSVTDLVANPSREISINQARKSRPGVQVGDQIRLSKPTEGLGRISAQMAKQVIFQKIREAERDTICAEFQDRLGNLETCTIKRSEGPDLIVDLGRTEARLPRREQSRLESFSPGDRVRIIIKTIEKAGRGPAVVVSRASEELVKRLFEQEVPEIYDGTVKIRACAREAGERTKIAVQSNDRDVDPVGACVGMKGMRVQSIIRELRGEKIDIIEFSEDPVELAGRALSPARISRVSVIDPMSRHLEVVVDDTQLSLAIGKKGQNVRLAAKLLGWRIDIKSEEEKRQEVEAAMAAMSGAGTPVSILIDYGLPEDVADKLIAANSATVEALADMTPEQLERIDGMNPQMLERIQLAVNAYYGQFEQPGVESARVEGAPDTFESQDSEQTAARQAGPMVVPGLPVEGAEDEEDDEEIPMDDFDTIKMRTSYAGSGSVSPDKDSDDETEESASLDESAS